MTFELAINGGRPVRNKPWPVWPQVTTQSETMLIDALRSGRWTVSGAYTGQEPYERQFAARYAAYHDVPYCAPTCHGSSALVVALEALGVGYGCEVLVPGITWVACASAVTGVGAVPILIDIDENTLCMSVEAAEAAITPRTAAIMLVHLFSSAADLDRFAALSHRHGIPLLEDCSQAHGARWGGKRVGSIGAVGAFSFQQTKLLTSGEGGAAITSDADLYDRMQQLRADGRRYVSRPRVGALDIEEVGGVQGRNYCLSEFHAALLLEGLTRLDAENEHRRANATQLERLLSAVGGVHLQGVPRGLTERTFYHLCLRVDLDEFGGMQVDEIAAAISAELGLGAVEPIDDPLNRNILYNPFRSTRTAVTDRAILDPTRFELPAAVQARRTHLTLPHRSLLGDAADLEDIAAAFSKVKDYAANRRSAKRAER